MAYISRSLISLSRHNGFACAARKTAQVSCISTGSPKYMSTLVEKFESAKNKLNTLKEDPGNEAKLKIYGLFKQSTVGPVNKKRPGMIDFVGRAKWDSWNTLGSITQDEAKQQYIEFINSLAGEEEAEATAQADSGQIYKNLVVTSEEGLTTIMLNRPKKKNAITWEMYLEWVSALEAAATDPKTVIVAVTGSGDYFCSGNDLSNFTQIPPEGPQKMAETAHGVLLKFVSAFIDFPKPLIGIVNGPAVGVSVTTLALYDLVYCTDRATFHTPFTNLGQSAEGCSSYIFPRLMGTSKASEMLFFNKKITAQEAKDVGLVSEIYPDNVFQQEVWTKVKAFAKLPPNSLLHSKTLTRAMDKETLHKVNKMECDRLVERWLSDECRDAIMAFFSKK